MPKLPPLNQSVFPAEGKRIRKYGLKKPKAKKKDEKVLTKLFPKAKLMLE